MAFINNMDPYIIKAYYIFVCYTSNIILIKNRGFMNTCF